MTEKEVVDYLLNASDTFIHDVLMLIYKVQTLREKKTDLKLALEGVETILKKYCKEAKWQFKIIHQLKKGTHIKKENTQ